MLSVDESLPAHSFLKKFTDDVFSQRPKAILIISAHWDTSEPALNIIHGTHDTIHDFYGFPRSLYKLKYAAPGAPELASRVKQLLAASGFNVNMDKKRGLDHGAWVPLMLMYPEANIPVCQLSLQSNRDGSYHYNMGRELAPLKNEGVLIIGSGATTHNIRSLHESDSVAPWAMQFNTWLKESLLEGRYEDVMHYEQKAPNAKTAHPWPEHFYPLLVAMGAAGEQSKSEQIHESWSLFTLSYASYKFISTE